MKSGSGNVYYVLELVTALSAVSFLVVRKVMDDRRSRTTKKAALKTMAGGKLDKNYEPHLQSGNCIVAATCNILWYHGKNGFPELIDGIDFVELEGRIDTIINSKGGYANNNVPETVEEYVRTYTSYQVEVKNKWYPKFSDVKKAAAKNPCLLGFAAGSEGAGPKVGHMTACVFASESDGKKLVGVMNGHKTEIVYFEWSKYNDFMSEFIFSKEDRDPEKDASEKENNISA